MTSQLSLAVDAQVSNTFQSTTSAAQDFTGVLAAAGAHLLLLLALLQVSHAPVWVHHVQPLMVTLISPPRPESPTSTLVPKANPGRSQLASKDPHPHNPPFEEEPSRAQPAPELAIAATTLPVAKLPMVNSPKPAVEQHTLNTPAPPVRKTLSATAASYLVMPPAEVPRLSKRAGESGTVWLHVVVDLAGLPVKVTLHRSSGFARLDEQALWAMRQARFKPHTEDGRAVEVDVIAPIEYPAD